MSSVGAALLGAASLLLLVAGAVKMADPSRTAGALAALGWPSATWVVRLGAGAEALLGAAGLTIGGRPVALLVAVSYLGFALFVIAALAAHTPIGTCGCFARADTPPHPVHVVVDGLLAGGAVVAAASGAPALIDGPVVAWIAATLLALVAYGALAGTPERRAVSETRARRDGGRR